MTLDDEFREFEQWLKFAHETYESKLEGCHHGCTDKIRGTLNGQTQMLLELYGAVEELGKLVKRRRRL